MPQGRQGHQGRLALLALALLASGCGGRARPAITVTPHVSLSTAPVDIRVTGLKPHAKTELVVTSTDAVGLDFASRDTYRTDAHGALDVPGPIAAMQTASGAFYSWSRSPRTFRIVVTQGRARLATTFMRELEPPRVEDVSLTLAKDGVIGFYAAPRHHAKRPALLVFGGGEGGLTTTYLASSLAARGYPTLALAYFKEPGLPSKLQNIPLEYFVRALRWLDRQPQVAMGHVFVLGVSRGSEAAQLLGVHFPNLVNGVIASVPSDYVNGCTAAPPARCSGAAWTLDGQAVPYAPYTFPGLVEFERDRIPDERIRGPAFLVCAGLDAEWPSCLYAHDAMRHLAHDPYPHELVEAPRAGHFVGALAPRNPGTLYDADERGREMVWPKLLAFLARNG